MPSIRIGSRNVNCQSYITYTFKSVFFQSEEELTSINWQLRGCLYEEKYPGKMRVALKRVLTL